MNSKKNHAKKLIYLLVGILFLPLAIYLFVLRNYVEVFGVVITAFVAIHLLNKLFEDKEDF